MADTIPNPEGIGDTPGSGAHIDERTGGKDMRLLRTAIKNGWPIPDEYREAVVKKLLVIVGQSDNERNKVAAARVLVAADKINVDREVIEKRLVPQIPPVEPTTIIQNNITNTVNLRKLTDEQFLELYNLVTSRRAGGGGDVPAVVPPLLPDALPGPGPG